MCVCVWDGGYEVSMGPEGSTCPVCEGQKEDGETMAQLYNTTWFKQYPLREESSLSLSLLSFLCGSLALSFFLSLCLHSTSYSCSHHFFYSLSSFYFSVSLST